MGLDMYLEKKTYVENWSHMKGSELTKIQISGDKAKGIRPERITYVTEQIAKWRKANAIHRWFVENVQEGKDDCGEYAVGSDQLKELAELCRKVLAEAKTKKARIKVGMQYSKGKTKAITEMGLKVTNPEACEKLLPTQSGFFFGGTEYDNYYIDDLKYTAETIEEALKECEKGAHGTFYYSSSW